MRNTMIVLLLGAGWVLMPTMTPVVRADEPIPMETCATCHEDVTQAFEAGPHGRAMAHVSRNVLSRACATCHEPAADHIEDPTEKNVRRRPERDACVSCHADAAGGMELAIPPHNRNGVACLDCHESGHHETRAKQMLRSQPAELCGGCHESEAAMFQLPYSHRAGTNHSFACTACHDPHGREETGRSALLENGGACVTCHAGKAGPYVFPHPPRRVNGCVSCHEPHGSMNPRQLNRRSMSDLCLECHADVPTFHDLTQARYRSCQRCHQATHGSNRDPKLFE